LEHGCPSLQCGPTPWSLCTQSESKSVRTPSDRRFSWHKPIMLVGTVSGRVAGCEGQKGADMDEENSEFAYQIDDPDEDVSLTVIIGQGQLGATEVFRDDVLLVKGGVVIGKLNLGKGSKQKTPISVESVVNDVSGQTNKMSVRYTLENGESRKEFVA